MRKLILVAILIVVLVVIFHQPTPNEQTSASEEIYYDSIESALKNSGISLGAGEKYQNTITKEIHRFENDDYLTLYYLSLKNKNQGCLILAKFQKKHNGKNVQYAFIGRTPVMVHRGSYKAEDGIELVKSNLQMLNMRQALNIDPENTTFMCGDNGDKNIYKLKIDGQSPDGVVAYELFNEERYFWYYENLATKNPADKMVITMD